MTVWQVKNYQVVMSPLTGNTIYVNLDLERFLITPEAVWDHDRLRRNLDALRQSPSWLHRNHRSHIFLETVAQLLGAPGPELLARTLDALMAARVKWGIKLKGVSKTALYAEALPWRLGRDRTRITELLTAFWRAGALALPAAGLPEFKKTRWDLGLPFADALSAESRGKGLKQVSISQALSALDDILTAITPIREAGDVVPDALNLIPLSDGLRSRTLTALRGLTALLVREHGAAAPAADSYWPRGLGLLEDTSFTWAVREDPGIAPWAALAATWLGQQKTTLAQKRDGLRWFLQALLDTPALPRDPGELLKMPSGDAPSGTPTLDLERLEPQRFNAAVDFLDWVIAERFSTRRPDGHLISNPGIRNPLERQVRTGQPAETSKAIMPSWLLARLIERLTEYDYAWARTALGRPESSNKGDWFFVANGADGGTWTWSPVRTIALLTKLLFPGRTGQTRHLESGEADHQIPVYDSNAPEGQQFRLVDNLCRVPFTLLPAKINPGAAKLRENLLRGAVQIGQGPMGTYPKLRFPTNKTADQRRDAWNRGYTAPWMPKDLAITLIWLRGWQGEHNPVNGTLPWTAVTEWQKGNTAKHESYLQGMESTFLFRDPTEPPGDQPISDSKVDGLYLALCLAVEQELAALGITSADGQPICLISTYDARGRAAGLTYSLHALRASIVTHFIEEGEVSPEIMMKIVGHSTVVMTLYYLKHNGEYVAAQMEKGRKNIDDKSKRGWIEVTRQKDLKNLRKFAVGRSDAAYQFYRTASPGSLLSMPVGVCPTGGTRCHEGGAFRQKMGGKEVYDPVPGGQNNCAKCRFLISGEPWLAGIVEEANLRSSEISRKNAQIEQYDQQLRPLTYAMKTCERQGRPFDDAERWQSLTNLKEETERARGDLLAEWIALNLLREQVQALATARMQNGDTTMALVVGDPTSVQIVIEESTDFDLWDRVCNAVDVYPSLATRRDAVAMASAFRDKAWNRFLREHGLDTAFLDLDPEMARHVGNRLTEWLDMRIGRPNTLMLMEGQATLDDLCVRSGLLTEMVLADLRAEIAQQVGGRLAAPAKPHMRLVGSSKPAAE